LGGGAPGVRGCSLAGPVVFFSVALGFYCQFAETVVVLSALVEVPAHRASSGYTGLAAGVCRAVLVDCSGGAGDFGHGRPLRRHEPSALGRRLPLSSPSGDQQGGWRSVKLSCNSGWSACVEKRGTTAELLAPDGVESAEGLDTRPAAEVRDPVVWHQRAPSGSPRTHSPGPGSLVEWRMNHLASPRAHGASTDKLCHLLAPSHSGVWLASASRTAAAQ